MHRLAPNFISNAYPKICADECQKAIFPLGSLKSNNSNVQSPSRGLYKSYNYDECDYSSSSSHGSIMLSSIYSF